MDNKKETAAMDLAQLDKVSGGTGCVTPEYIRYEDNPDKYDAILQGHCPNCNQDTVSQVGSACYGCSNCDAGFVLVGGPG